VIKKKNEGTLWAHCEELLGSSTATVNISFGPERWHEASMGQNFFASRNFPWFCVREGVPEGGGGKRNNSILGLPAASKPAPLAMGEKKETGFPSGHNSEVTRKRMLDTGTRDGKKMFQWGVGEINTTTGYYKERSKGKNLKKRVSKLTKAT